MYNQYITMTYFVLTLLYMGQSRALGPCDFVYVI